MKRGCGIGRAVLGLVAALAAAVTSSCAAPQPDECAAYLACFYPDGEPSPYAAYSELAPLAEQRDDAIALYGIDGECWQNGADDPLYATCLAACRDALAFECEVAGSEDTRPPICVEDKDGALTFAPPGAAAELSHSCVELTEG